MAFGLVGTGNDVASIPFSWSTPPSALVVLVY